MTLLSKNRIKFIRSLSRKKERRATGLFVVEGDKMVRELMGALPGSIPYRVEYLAAVPDWLNEFGGIIPRGTECLQAKPADLQQASCLHEPNRVLAVVRQADYLPDPAKILEKLTLGLERIRDPGNLGAIIRIADWFGIRDILCSEDCVELYNPRVIQSTMGSFLRVRVHPLPLDQWIVELKNHPADQGREPFPVFAAAARGENLYQADLPEKGMILLGNESTGLPEFLMQAADRVLSIPPWDKEIHAESLNVAAATAVFCAEFRRRSKQ
jgi:TrmH family RNA methyltransferase